MSDLALMAFRQRFPLLRLQQLVIKINLILEDYSKDILSDLLTSSNEIVSDSFYAHISRNFNIEYSGDRDTYVVVYSIFEKIDPLNAKDDTEFIISNLD